MPAWIKKAKQIGLVWEDMNKRSPGLISGSGGIIAVLAFVSGILALIAYQTFFLKTSYFSIEIISMLSVILLLAGVGLIDDLLGWRHGGLSIQSRLILTILSTVPLVVINVGNSDIALPFIGLIHVGLIYPLIFVPIGIVGAATTFNILAGFNGLESGQGIILLSAIAFVSFMTGNSLLGIIALTMVAALFAFLFYNFFPAQVFPGDSLTYAVGGLIAIIPILGNFEKIAVFFFIPYIAEVILKSRGRLKKYSFGKPNSDGTLSLRYDRLYSINHVAIYLLNKAGIKATEKRCVYLIWLFQLAIVVVGLIVFRKGIFL